MKTDIEYRTVYFRWADFKGRGILGDSEETVKENYKHLQPDYLRDIINWNNDTAQFVLQPS